MKIQLIRTYKNIIIIIFLSLIVFNIHSNAQNKNTKPLNFPDPKFEYLTIANGLPENSVWSIFQDHLGFLWFGTQNGLVKYDGYSILVYQPQRDDSLSLSDRWTRAIFEDHNNSLWIGTVNGLNQFNRETQTFKRYYFNQDHSTIVNSNYVRSIYEDSKNRLWVGTHSGINLFNSKKNTFEQYSFTDTIPLPIYDIIEEPKTGNLFVGSERAGLWKFDVKQKIFTKSHVPVEAMPGYIPSWILSFLRSSDGTFWMATTHGLARLDSEEKEIKYYQLISSKTFTPLNEFNSVLEDKYGLIWVGSGYSGLISFDPKTEKFQVNKPEQDNPYSLSNSRVWSIYEDHSGIIWAGTWGGGLNKWDRKKWKFNSVYHESENTNSLINNIVNSFCEDRNGTIWIGTDAGLDKFDKDKNIFTHLQHNPNNINSLSSNSISSVVEDHFEPGVLWIGTRDAGLNKFDTKRNIFLRYQNNPEDKNSLNDSSINTLLSDHLGNIWIGTQSGLVRLDQKAGIFTSFKHNPNDPESLSQNEVRALYEDTSGNIWVGTNKGGLNKFIRKSRKFIRYESLTNDRDYSSIITITEDWNRNLWVGTHLSGLHLFIPATGNLMKSLTPENGLSTNGIMGILKDESDHIWISTLNGIFKYNTKTDSLRAYGIADGLSGTEFIRGSELRSKNGEMFFGGQNGITFFNPDNVRDDPIPPTVVISNISLFNRPDERLTFDGFISELKEIELNYDQNDLQFEFVSLHFGEPKKNQYKYILENFDDSWVDAGTQRKAIYTNLDAGEYIFRVKAANRDGVWSEQVASIKVIIVPPMSATWWAYIIYGLFALSALFFIRRYELNRVQWKNTAKLDEVKLKEREETDKMKSRFFANISHEFRTPLTLILGPSENIITKSSEEETKKQAGVIKKNASRLLDLINQLLDLSKLEAGKLKLEASFSNIVSFVRGITMSFESLAERKKISLKVETDNEIIDVYFDKDNLSKALINLLSNAFKFTPEGGEITASLTLIPFPDGRGMSDLPARSSAMIGGQGEGKVQISVSDSGAGIAEKELSKLFDRFYQVDSSQTREHAGTGIGLALTKELIELHKGSISVDSKEGKGTKFTIELPLGRDHLSDEDIVKSSEKIEEEIIVDDEKFILSNKIQKESKALFEDKNIVLVVEDNADVREYIKDSLRDEYQVEEAVNGVQGVKKAEKIIPDLIISDVMMPKMDGNELTRILKNDEKTSHIPIILLTAKAGQESKLEGLETGADTYLTKPFDPIELQVRIKNLLNIRKKLQEKYSKGISVQKLDKKKISDLDEKFMSKVWEVIENHIAEEEFSIEEFDREIGIGRVQIYRKVKALTGKSPSRYIRSLRLARARKMIEEKKGNIAEIAYSVGFGSPAYFTKCFKEEFGFPPSDLTN